MKEATTNYENLMPCNSTHSARLIPLCRINNMGLNNYFNWLRVGKARFVIVGIYHAHASLSHHLPRCPGESNFQLACYFQT